MKNIIVPMDSIKTPIAESPGFEKKELSHFKLDIMGLCEFGCRYCSSNNGNYLRINRKRFADLTEKQTGQRLYPTSSPQLTFHWKDILEKLEAQLSNKKREWGAGQTLVFSMQTDGFSPSLVANGTTRAVLERVLEYTSFRIRILTKNAVVGSPEWVEFFKSHPGRFVVGLSTGTTDDRWARRVELGTSPPSMRLDALRRLQKAGVPTYGMLCPIFPDMMDSGNLNSLIKAINPANVEHIWAEPYNDRQNWREVRGGYTKGSAGYDWMTQVYEVGDMRKWSLYAGQLYMELRRRAERGKWLNKLRYLLYEECIHTEHIPLFQNLEGILLQSNPGAHLIGGVPPAS
jgi:DNA repair photolyase